jgi:hypothetical protein
MALSSADSPAPNLHTRRALTILAKSIYREFRASGYGEKDVMALAGELLGMVAHEVQERRGPVDD